MAKSKTPGGVSNRPIYSRVSFLYQAAAYLAAPQQHAQAHQAGDVQDGRQEIHAQTSQLQGMSRRLATDLRTVAQKTLIRVSPEMKRTICKYCDTLLVEGKTCTSVVENMSKGGKKPWADILVLRCNTCGGEKRFPVQAPRQKRRAIREREAQEALAEAPNG
ncbi:hypothetical protein NKR23_g1698 [Pleurostoma richardsiae]|uniref:Uncharacterized protein n=1 Tax=Pleurostoma richardsiae TaxID=41990 RepID=A0AA38VYV5_9PEZI|nr:hypothetical protein NKR23_g1698 [Pleurostoma richardsiae]